MPWDASSTRDRDARTRAASGRRRTPREERLRAPREPRSAWLAERLSTTKRFERQRSGRASGLGRQHRHSGADGGGGASPDRMNSLRFAVAMLSPECTVSSNLAGNSAGRGGIHRPIVRRISMGRVYRCIRIPQVPRDPGRKHVSGTGLRAPPTQHIAGPSRPRAQAGGRLRKLPVSGRGGEVVFAGANERRAIVDDAVDDDVPVPPESITKKWQSACRRESGWVEEGLDEHGRCGRSRTRQAAEPAIIAGTIGAAIEWYDSFCTARSPDWCSRSCISRSRIL